MAKLARGFGPTEGESVSAATQESGGPSRLGVVVMGVAACGKSSVGEALARRMRLDFVDGDALHPRSNIEKMASAHPLTDEDRWPWLDRVGAELADGAAHPGGVVVACSALRRIYRERIRAAANGSLVFVFLDITLAEAKRRIAARTHHFMPPSLVDSQFATLERPTDETDVVTISRLVDAESSAQDAAEQIADRWDAAAQR